MSWQATSWATSQRVTATATEQLVLVILANYAGEDGRNAFPSVARLSRETRLSERAVQKTLRRLEEMTLIRQGNQKIAEAHIDRPDKRPTVYDLNLSLVEIAPESTGDGVNVVHPADERGEPDDASGVNLTTERGERGAPDPSLNHQENPSARASAREALVEKAGGDAAPDGASPPFGDRTATTSDAARPQGALEEESVAGAAAKQPMTEAARERLWRQNFIIDWLVDGRSPEIVCERIGLNAARLDDAGFEREALGQRDTYVKAVAGFVRWAEQCLAGDVAAPPPIAPVKRLMAALADPVRAGLMARRLALIRARDAEIRRDEAVSAA